MMNYRVWSSGVLLAITGACIAQSWRGAYEAGLGAARSLKWTEARQDFKQAAAYRPDDVSGSTILPGPPTEQRKWRDGAPYSPNFLAAYCEYRAALTTTKSDDQVSLLNTAAMELTSLVNKRQLSPETFFVLTSIYDKLGDQAKLTAFRDKYADGARTSTWKVDTEVVRPEELSQITAFVTGQINSEKPPASNTRTSTNTINVRDINPVTGQQLPTIGGTGAILQLPNKFALVIGVSNSNLAGNLDYSSYDAQRVRDSLVNNAGYAAANVDLLIDPPAATMLARAKALAARMPDSGTLCIYYSGVGCNIQGVDYIAGSDATSLGDASGMVRKNDLFGQFFAKATHMFAFFQANRSNTPAGEAGFGSERQYEGSVAQMQSTIAGGTAFPTYRNGKKTGLFTDAFIQTLSDLQSNRIPIQEFGWQLFNHIRGGDTGQLSGSSQQIPTLPALNNLAADAQF